MIKTIIFNLKGNIVPKARPRVTRNGTFMPASYRKWKNEAVNALSESQFKNLENVTIEVILIGKHCRRGDADNIIGSILDALVQSGIIRNDNLACISEISIKLKYNARIDPYTVIKITPIE